MAASETTENEGLPSLPLFPQLLADGPLLPTSHYTLAQACAGSGGETQGRGQLWTLLLRNGHNPPSEALRTLGWAYTGHFLKRAVLTSSAADASLRGVLSGSPSEDACQDHARCSPPPAPRLCLR